jgi:hypothetical protein
MAEAVVAVLKVAQEDQEDQVVEVQPQVLQEVMVMQVQLTQVEAAAVLIEELQEQDHLLVELVVQA